MIEKPEMASVWTSIKQLLADGVRVIMVHGGGPQATAMATRLGHTSKMVQGRRVTTELDLSIMQWSLRGELNTALSAQAVKHGIVAAGISGVDGATVVATKRPPRLMGDELVDFGFVGDVVEIRPQLIQALLDGGIVPILGAMSVDTSGQVFNLNADTIAVEIAKTFSADRLLMVTESGGLRHNVDDPDSHINTCNTELYEQGITEGWVGGGMIVKVKTALDAARAGVKHVEMVGADLQHGTVVTV